MGTSSLVALAGMGMVAMLVLFVGSILIAGLVLCVAFRLVMGYMPSYLRSLGVVLLTAAAAVAAAIALAMLMQGGANGVAGVAVEFLVGAAVVNYLLLSQDGRRIGYPRACLVQLVYLAIGFVLAVILSAILAAVFGTAVLGMH